MFTSGIAMKSDTSSGVKKSDTHTQTKTHW